VERRGRTLSRTPACRSVPGRSRAGAGAYRPSSSTRTSRAAASAAAILARCEAGRARVGSGVRADGHLPGGRLYSAFATAPAAFDHPAAGGSLPWCRCTKALRPPAPGARSPSRDGARESERGTHAAARTTIDSEGRRWRLVLGQSWLGLCRHPHVLGWTPASRVAWLSRRARGGALVRAKPKRGSGRASRPASSSSASRCRPVRIFPATPQNPERARESRPPSAHGPRARALASTPVIAVLCGLCSVSGRGRGRVWPAWPGRRRRAPESAPAPNPPACPGPPRAPRSKRPPRSPSSAPRRFGATAHDPRRRGAGVRPRPRASARAAWARARALGSRDRAARDRDRPRPPLRTSSRRTDLTRSRGAGLAQRRGATGALRVLGCGSRPPVRARAARLSRGQPRAPPRETRGVYALARRLTGRPRRRRGGARRSGPRDRVHAVHGCGIGDLLATGVRPLGRAPPTRHARPVPRDDSGAAPRSPAPPRTPRSPGRSRSRS